MLQYFFIFFLAFAVGTSHEELVFQRKESVVLKQDFFKEKNYISLKDAGIKGDSVTDITPQLQELLSKYDTVFFSKGNYLISSGLQLKTGQVIAGDGLANLINKSISTAFNFFDITSKENIKITGINFIAKAGNKNIVNGVQAANIKGLVLRNIKTENAGLLLINSPAVGYAKTEVYKAGDINTRSTNVNISDCSCTGTTLARGNTSGVIFYFVDNWKVSNSSFKNYNHGIQWWGGDSNPLRNGDTGNIRKAKNGIIENVTVDNVAAGGIWGSMGENIVILKCKVSNCGDVGIDFEGCFNCTAKNNKVINCNNGCLTTFHFNKNILFDSNTISQANSAKPLSCIYNYSQSQHNGLVHYINNTFSTSSNIGFIYEQGPSNNIVFEKNKLENIVINFKFNNNRIISIRNNFFYISKPIKDFDFVIKAGETNNNGILTIENNRIVSTVIQPETVFAINAYQADFNSSPENRLNNNTITGFKKKIKIEWNGTNPGVASKTFIKSGIPILRSEIEITDKTKTSQVTINHKKW